LPQVRMEGGKERGRRVSKIEVYVTAYPKSGITWLIRLLSDALRLTQRDLQTGPVQGFWGKNGAGGVIRKRHEHWQPKYDGRTVVFLERDPRDVVVSAMKYRGSDDLAGAVRLLGIPLYQDYSGQEVTYEQWIRSWDGKPAIHTRYTRLKADTVAELGRICQRLTGQKVRVGRLVEAVENHSIENMRQALGAHFCRKGEVGDWRHHFTRAIGREMDGILGAFMLDRGYIDSRDWWKGLPE